MKDYKKILFRTIAVCLIMVLITGSFGNVKAVAASKPAKPSFKVTKRTKTTATIKIKKKGKVSGYHVYIKSSKKGRYQVIPTISRTLKLKKLKKNKVYYVKIRAFRTKGLKIKFGKFSKTIKIGKYKKTTKKDNTNTANNSNNTNSNNNTNTSNTDTTKKYAEEVLRLVNIERTSRGLAAYSLDETLCAGANIRAQEIVTNFSHTRPDGTEPYTVLDQYNYQSTSLGENIAAGQTTPAEVVETWMNSDGHRANILSESFTKMGVGYYESSSGYRYYWVQLFSN